MENSDGFIRMNKKSGIALLVFCQPHYFMDWADLMELTGIRLERLQEYFSGVREMTEQDMRKIARVCGKEPDDLRSLLTEAYRRGVAEEKGRHEQELRYQQLVKKREEEEKIRLEHEKRKKAILEDLSPFGITRIYETEGEYLFDDYYPLKFIIHFLWKEEMLPKLKDLLATCTDDDLVYGDSNALLWTADSNLAYEKLLLLADRKEFINKHIMSRWRHGRTVLHYYASRSIASGNGVQLLIDWGADVNATDDYLWTPLHEAEAAQHDPVVSALVRNGAISTRNSLGDFPHTIRDRLDAIDAW